MLSQGTNQAKARSVICAAGRLIHCLDRISADGLDRLVTVRAKVSPGLRFEEGLCLLKVIPFRDCYPLARQAWFSRPGHWCIGSRRLPAGQTILNAIGNLLADGCQVEQF